MVKLEHLEVPCITLRSLRFFSIQGALRRLTIYRQNIELFQSKSKLGEQFENDIFSEFISINVVIIIFSFLCFK